MRRHRHSLRSYHENGRTFSTSSSRSRFGFCPRPDWERGSPEAPIPPRTVVGAGSGSAAGVFSAPSAQSAIRIVALHENGRHAGSWASRAGNVFCGPKPPDLVRDGERWAEATAASARQGRHFLSAGSFYHGLWRGGGRRRHVLSSCHSDDLRVSFLVAF